MKAHTINEAQKKKTLSAKKHKHKKKEKSVLTTSGNLPPEISFKGCELSNEECVELEILMLKYNTYNPPEVKKWSELKNLTKEERKKLRVKVEIPCRKFLALGYNEVNRSLENKSALIVIMSGEISPNNLNLQIYRCCEIYKIPLIKVANLKQISKNCFGFSSMAMAFISKIPSDERIYELYHYLETSYIHPFKQNMKSESIPPEVNKRVKNLSLLSNKEKIVPEPKPRSDIYLNRNSMDKRTFVPKPRREENKSLSFDFISLDDSAMTTNISSFDEEDSSVVPFPDTCQMRSIMRRMRIKKIAANQFRKLPVKKK